MGPQKIKNGVTVKPADKKRILTGNVNLIDKVRKRADHNLKVLEASKSFPLICENFDSIAMRKDFSKEFSKKEIYSYRCTLNALNNCLPRGVYLQYEHMHILRDLKLLQLSKGAMVNMEKDIPEYPVESLVSLYENIYLPISTKEPLQYKASKDNWPLDCSVHLHMLTEPRLQLWNPLKVSPFDVALPPTAQNEERTRKVMEIMEFYNSSSLLSPSLSTLNACAVWLLQLYTEDHCKRSTTKAKLVSAELQEQEIISGVEHIGQLHCVSIDLRDGIGSGLILDDRQNGPLQYNFENMIKVQTMPNAETAIGIYNVYGIRTLIEPSATGGLDLNCIPCAKIFQSAAALASHLKEHKICKSSGCSFAACQSVLTKHCYTLHPKLLNQATKIGSNKG